MTNEPEPVRSASLDHDSIYHAFHTRAGGVSTGIYKGLNTGIGSDDNREDVLENRARVARHADVVPDNLVTLYQVHSPDVVTVSAPFAEDHRPQADGIASAKPGLAIGILTADCGPVLFCDPENRVIAAAHAGWRGATSGVLENSIIAMEKLGAKRETIKAVLGPTISAKNYEVGPEFVDNLLELDPANDTFLKASNKPDHAMFDLPAYIVNRLKHAGIKAEWTGNCTYADEENFFSFRRTTHRAEPDYGRQISVIAIKS